MEWSIRKKLIAMSLFMLFFGVLRVTYAADSKQPTPPSSRAEIFLEEISRTSTDYSIKIKAWYKKNNTVFTVLPGLFRVRVVDAWMIIFCVLLPFGLLIRYLFR